MQSSSENVFIIFWHLSCIFAIVQLLSSNFPPQRRSQILVLTRIQNQTYKPSSYLYIENKSSQGLGVKFPHQLILAEVLYVGFPKDQIQ